MGNVVHFDFLHIEEIEAADGVDTLGDLSYKLVLLEDVSGEHMRFIRARACTEKFFAR